MLMPLTMLWKRLLPACLSLLAIAALWTWQPAALAQTDPSALTEAVGAIEALDALRSGLAGTLEGAADEPTLETFKQVCRPVGMQAQQLSQSHGWSVRQVATKYRNPTHQPQTLTERLAIARFEREAKLQGFWQRETFQGREGTGYYRRIDVQASCLACHGAKDARPAFVREKYPNDLAYDFHIGDLRGMYAVFIPDSMPEIQAALH